MSDLKVVRARWLRDGKRIALMGQASAGAEWRLYVVPLEGGTPVPVSDVAVSPYYFEVSRDDRLVAARDVEGVLTLYPLGGGLAVRLPELGPDVVPIGWTTNGQLWLMGVPGLPRRLLRYDVRSRTVVEERTLSPADPAGVTTINRVCITPDGRAVAFDYERSLSNLYLLDGLARPRR